MLKIAHLAPVVLTLWVAPALAAPPGCLQQIDNMTVEFDLPAAESVATTESSSAYYIPPPPSSQITVPPPPTMTPAGRPGAPHVTSGSDTMGAPPLSPHNRLSKAQSAKLQSLLRQARGLEALGNEQQCFEVLAQAQELAKAQPAPAPAPARAKTRTPRPSKPS
jgi:hypothetical protein